MGTQHKKILIVDDDARNVFALSAVLKAKGYTCLAAGSVKEALGVLERDEQVGIILLDMMMPDIDGYEAIPMIRSENGYGNIPVIAVTAQAMVGDKERCLRAGADDYLSKPVNVDDLERILQSYLK